MISQCFGNFGIAARTKLWALQLPYIAVIVVFAASRVFYHYELEIKFDYTPVYYFIQYINPWFIEHDFWRSIFYLHQQAPLQNLLVGGCLRIFGDPFAFKVLTSIYVALGLVTVLCMIHVMLKLGASRTVATVATCLYAASPVTVFYENWLFYHMPVAALMLLSLVALLRFYRMRTWAAALTFFCLLGTISLFYALFNPILMVAIALALLLRAPGISRQCIAPRKRIVAALVIPLALVVINLEKTQLLVGHSHGSAFLWENLAVKTFDGIRPIERERLESRGLITGAPKFVLFTTRIAEYGRLRVAHQPTGVPLLDLEQTPDGNVNPHTIEKILIAEKHYKHDAFYFFRHRFVDYWRAVVDGLTLGYVSSAFVFDDSVTCENRVKLAPLQKKVDSLFLRDSQGRLLVLAVVLPVTLIYGLYRLLSARSWLTSERSAAAAFSFMCLIVVYVTVATNLVAVGDFSRYRFNIDQLFLIMFVLLITDIARQVRAFWNRCRQPSGTAGGLSQRLD